ncbi:MAG: hypothetical protein QOC70_1686 [Verrucomicrobiota bacterium]|jgi:hypothetical protein
MLKRALTIFAVHQLFAVILVICLLSPAPGANTMVRAISRPLFEVVVFPFSILLSHVAVSQIEHPSLLVAACIAAWIASPLLWIALFVLISRLRRRPLP